MLYTGFTLDEMDKIVRGNPTLNWNELKESAEYNDDYSESSQVIKWFWQYFDRLTQEKRFELLKFIRGTSSFPSSGLKDIHINIRMGYGVYPQAHTCYELERRLNLFSLQIMRIYINL